MKPHRLPAGRRLPPLLIAVAAMLSLAACSSVRETLPARAATEQMLISMAADRAAEAVAQYVPADQSIYLDATNFEGTDGKYAVAAIRENILRRGASLVPERDKAQVVVEIRSGALSVDKTDSLVGIPSMKLPIPLTTDVQTPEVALYKDVSSTGVAKFAATSYDAASGKLVSASGPQYGLSHRTERTLLLFINWTSQDYMPEEDSVLPQLNPEKMLP